MADNKDKKRPRNADGTYNVAKGSNLLSKLLMKKINKSKANKGSKKLMKDYDKLLKKSDKAIKKHLKDQKKQAKKAAIDAAPGTSSLEKRLNIAGAKARARDAERQEKRSKRKADREVKRDLRKSGRAVKRATIESMPGTTMLEKRLNFAGAKARARKADREETKRLKKEGPLQYTPTKAAGDFLNKEVKSPLLKRKELKVLETPMSPDEFNDLIAKNRARGRKKFEEAFAKARREKGPGQTFMYNGKEYTTNYKEEENKAKHGASLAIMIAPVKTKKMKAVKKAPGGASMKKMSMYKDGGSLKPVPSDNKGLGKLPKKVRNKMGYMKNGGKVTDPKKKRKTGELISDSKDKSVSKKIKGLEPIPTKVGKGDGYLMLPSNPPKYKNMKTKEVISESEYYKRTGKKKSKSGIMPLKYGGSMKKAMYGAKMKKAQNGGKLTDPKKKKGINTPPEDYGKLTPMVDKMARLRRAEKNKLQKKAEDNRAKPIRSKTRRVKKINTPSLELRDDRPYSKRPRKDYIPQTVRDRMKAKKAQNGGKITDTDPKKKKKVSKKKTINANRTDLVNDYLNSLDKNSKEYKETIAYMDRMGIPRP